MRNWVISISLAVILITVAATVFLIGDQTKKPEPERLTVLPTTTITPTLTPTILPSPVVLATSSAKIAPVEFDKAKTYQITLKTSAGEMVLELSKETPITSKNFYDLAKKGFYDGIIFHRIIKGFMIQGGDPTGTGMGGPGYKFADEPFTGKYLRGTLAMANSGPNTNGSQFFIMHADYPLPPNYTIFGKLISGFETLDKIATAPTDSSDRPESPIKILSATIKE